MRAIVLAAVLLIAVGCGQVQGRPAAAVTVTATPSSTAGNEPSPVPTESPAASPASTPKASPVATPKTSPTLLFAVLEAKGTANAWTYNTVAIAGLDGYARAKTTFAPMPVPNLGCMGAVLPPSAHVAAGKVFFSDAKGVIRSLAIDGTVTTAATFPMTSSQQMLSFAASPDGTKLLGVVYTVPTNAFSCDGSNPNGTYSFDAFSATNGGPSVLVYHQTWAKPQDVLALTGWDSVGPIGTYPTIWASQGGGPGSTLGVIVRIDSTTIKPLAALADPTSCQVWDSIASGSFVCMGDGVMTGGGTADQRVTQPLSVRSAAGTELWHATVTGQNAPFRPLLAPDAQHLMICCNDLNVADPYELLVSRDGAQVKLAKGFGAAGWLDSNTMLGGVTTDPMSQTPPPLAYVKVNAPGTANSMGFSGLFVGTVRA